MLPQAKATERLAKSYKSLNTVARHISNIFGKTGSGNRAEAATYANQKKVRKGVRGSVINPKSLQT